MATVFSVPLLVYQAQICVEKGQTLDLRTHSRNTSGETSSVCFQPSFYLPLLFVFYVHVSSSLLTSSHSLSLLRLSIFSFTALLQYLCNMHFLFFCGFSSFLLCLSCLSSCSIPLTRLSGCSFCWLPLLHFSISPFCWSVTEASLCDKTCGFPIFSEPLVLFIIDHCWVLLVFSLPFDFWVHALLETSPHTVHTWFLVLYFWLPFAPVSEQRS